MYEENSHLKDSYFPLLPIGGIYVPGRGQYLCRCEGLDWQAAEAQPPAPTAHPGRAVPPLGGGEVHQKTHVPVGQPGAGEMNVGLFVVMWSSYFLALETVQLSELLVCVCTVDHFFVPDADGLLDVILILGL